MYSENSWHHNATSAEVIHKEDRNLHSKGFCREHSLEDLFFPVSSRPLYWERDNDYFLVLKECERHYAVVDEEREVVFSTVTDGYELVTNKKAYAMGRKLAEAILIPFRNEGLGCIDFTLTGSKAACEIDIARDVQVGQPLIAGEWIPIIRVGNSYNKTRMLEFNIGFFNPADKLHMMSNKPLKYPHNAIASKDSFHDWTELIRKSNTVKDEISAFEQKMNTLRNLQLSPNLILQLFSKYFKVFITTDMKMALTPEKWEVLVNTAMGRLSEGDRACREFCRKHGANGYTLLLVLAACIERGTKDNLKTADQQKLGKWSDELIAATKSPRFSWFDYIGREAADTVTYYDMHKRD